jgi:ParB-like chromosome segregation protein Spo0J
MMTHPTDNISPNTQTTAASNVTAALSVPAQPDHEVAKAAAHDSMPGDHKKNKNVVTRKPEYLDMSLVRTDGGTQARVEINNAIVEEYAEAQREGAELPPVVLYHDKDVDIYWLADGFHRFQAHRLNGRDDILAVVRDGTRRDAVLHAAGANGAHGLRRSNADKRRAVTMLLKDVEWVQWSDREIAKACDVSHMLVATVRREHLEEMPDSLAPAASINRTVTRNGTTYEQKVKSKPSASKPSKPRETPLAAAPTDAPMLNEVIDSSTTEMAPVQLTEIRVGELHTESAQLRPEKDDLYAQLQDRDAQLSTAISEKDALTAQLGDLIVMFQEAMTCHDEMRAILEAEVPPDEMPDQLRQARALSRMLESRVTEAPRRQVDAQSDQAGITQDTAAETAAHSEGIPDLNGVESFDCQLSNDDMTQAPADDERGANPDAAEVPEDDQQAAKSCNQ